MAEVAVLQSKHLPWKRDCDVIAAAANTFVVHDVYGTKKDRHDRHRVERPGGDTLWLRRDG